MKKTYPVVMLPTEKANPLCIQKNGTLEYTGNTPIYGINELGFKPQHLYILSNDKNDKIKDGDWFINDDGLWQCNGGIIPTSKNPRKVIATTDKLFEHSPIGGREVGGFSGHIPVSKIHESFIHVFVKAYNDKNTITEVDLEVLLITHGKNKEELNENSLWVPKTRPDNTVIISPSKVYSTLAVAGLLRIFERDYNKADFDKSNETERSLFLGQWIIDNVN